MDKPAIIANENRDGIVPSAWTFLTMRRFESSVGIIGGVVEEQLKIAVA